MNRRKALTPKVFYMILMAALLLPLFWLSQPSSPPRKGSKGSPGGKLSQLREQYGLAQTQLGEIDPTSEVIKWSTFGMRGVAVTALWKKAETYKMKKDWTNYSAVLNQLMKLQPNFVSVWRHQCWNYSFNISREFDDYRDRYRYVIKGIRFLQEGIRHNQREPILPWDVGWFLQTKIGKADEWRQFRRLFQQDDDFHGSRPMAERDNWLVAKQWYLKVQELVDAGGKMKSSPSLYRSDAPKCMFNYAEALEKEGTFGEKVRRIWRQAGEEWRQYGDFDIPHSSGLTIRLNDQEKHESLAKKAVAELDSLAPGVREKLVEEKRKALSPEQREALDASEAERSGEQQRLAAEAAGLVAVTHREVAGRVKGENRKRALALVNEIARSEEMANCIERERGIVNYLFWRQRAVVEQTRDMIDAREALFLGKKAFDNAQLQAALEAYEKAFVLYRKVFDQFPTLIKDRPNDALANSDRGIVDRGIVDDLMEAIGVYKKDVLRAVDKPFPEDFPLKDVLEEYLKQHPEKKAKQSENAEK